MASPMGAADSSYTSICNLVGKLLRSIFKENSMDHFRSDRGENRAFTMRPAIPGLRGLLIGAAVLVVVLLSVSFLLRVTRIEAGHVGVEINLAGSQRGASEIPVRTGWVVYSPVNTQIIEFSTYVQTVKWTKDISEGHPINEEMGFNSREGMADLRGCFVVLRDRSAARAGLLRQVSRQRSGTVYARHSARHRLKLAQ
jgi:hypothetical protein